MTRSRLSRTLFIVLTLFAWTATPVRPQQGKKGAEWRFYEGDTGSTKYSPLDQIKSARRDCLSSNHHGGALQRLT